MTKRFSALQRAENSSTPPDCCDARAARGCFSALQRAENSSILAVSRSIVIKQLFQCSSASRKFLNERRACAVSADRVVSVLFSEPKIPQLRMRC